LTTKKKKGRQNLTLCLENRRFFRKIWNFSRLE